MRLVLTQIQLSVLYLRVISLQVIPGGILLWLCVRNYALHGQNPGLKTQLLHEFLDTSLISSACVLCQECQLLFFQTEPPSFSTTQHTHAHTHTRAHACAHASWDVLQGRHPDGCCWTSFFLLYAACHPEFSHMSYFWTLNRVIIVSLERDLLL